MVKKLLVLLALPLLLVGCATTFTNLTPQQQTRNPDNLYPVEFALASRQQTLRWDSIQPKIVVGSESYTMRPTPLMTNRWEGLLPVARGQKEVQYRYKVDFDYNSLGNAKSNSYLSAPYTLKINDR